MFKNDFVARFGLLTGILVLFSACAVGEIGEAQSPPGLDTGFNDEAQSPPRLDTGFNDTDAGVAAGSDPGMPGAPSQFPPSPADPTCPGAAPDVSASNGWRSSDATLSAYDSLYFEFKARPGSGDLNGLVAVGAEDINAFDEAAIAVRFAGDGLVDARDGTIYSSDLLYEYDPEVWYSVAISANIATETYDVQIGRCGEKRETLIEGASFRHDAEISDRLSTWAVWSSQSAALELATPTWMASGSCAPASCQSLGQACGQPSDGCGGSLNCGGCEVGDACASGLCVANSTPAPVDPPPAPADPPPAPVDPPPAPVDPPPAPVDPPPAPVDPPPATGGPKPSPSNTGVVNAGALRSWPYGSKTITEPGVYENFTSTDGIIIEADNVTLRNCRITGGYYNVKVDRAASNVLVEDCELTGANNCVLDYGSGSTFRRVWCHDQQSDAMKFAGSNTVLEYSLLEKIGMNGTTGHHDLVQATGCSNCEIRFSNLRGETCKSPPYHQSVAVIVEQLPNEFVIRDSWLEGGSAPSIINGSSAAATRLRNNKFGTYYNSAVYTGGNFINDGGNVFECDNSPVNSGNPPRPGCAVPFPSSSCQ